MENRFRTVDGMHDHIAERGLIVIIVEHDMAVIGSSRQLASAPGCASGASCDLSETYPRGFLLCCQQLMAGSLFLTKNWRYPARAA